MKTISVFLRLLEIVSVTVTSPPPPPPTTPPLVTFMTTPGEDPCSSDPCLNDSTCLVSGNTYTCECQNGFTGQHCETGKPTASC